MPITPLPSEGRGKNTQVSNLDDEFSNVSPKSFKSPNASALTLGAQRSDQEGARALVEPLKEALPRLKVV